MSSYLNSYSDMLNEAMKYFGLSVNDLSQKTGLLPKAIESYLSGEIKPSRGTTSIINDALFKRHDLFTMKTAMVKIMRVHPQGYAFGEDESDKSAIYIPNSTVSNHRISQHHEGQVFRMSVVPSHKRHGSMVSIKIHRDDM